MRRSEKGSNALWVGANGVSLLALSLILFRLQAPVTFFRYDGTFFLALVKNQAEWMPRFDSYTIDFLKGIGGPWFPFNTRLMPGFVVGLLGGDGDWLPALAATWFAMEFALGTLVIARALEFPVPVAVAAVWLGLFGALPYLVPTPALERLWGNPHVLTFIALTMGSLGLFLAIGRGSRWHAVRRAGGICLILAYLTFINPLSSPLILPVVTFFGVVALLSAEPGREVRAKLTAAAALVALYLGFFAAWLPGYFLYAKTTFFWSEMYPAAITWRWASLLVEDPSRRPAGVVFLLLALTGGVLRAFGPASRLRRFAVGYLAFVALEWAVTGFMIATRIRWSGPPISYLDLMIYPLHALFAASVLYRCLLKVAPRIGGPTRLRKLVVAAGVVVPWIALALWVAPYDRPLLKNRIPFGWPPRPTPIVELLQREIGLRPGQAFRGRVANLAGARFEAHYTNAPFINQHNYDGMVAFLVGNDHREYGFWFYDIPTLDDTNPIASPFFHFLMARLLNPERAWFFRPHETASLFDSRILAQLGVRYALTDEPLPGRRAVLTMELVPTRTQYLYELTNPNVAGRGVTRVTIARTAAEALARMRAADYDGEQEAVLFDRLPDTDLVPVSRSQLVVHRGALGVRAEAPGRALLVLPIAYSRCLQFDWESPGADPPVELRANLDLTAIWFRDRLSGRLALRSGPLVNPTCRLRDLRDARRVDLGGSR